MERVKVYHEHTTGVDQVHFQFYDFDKFQDNSDFTFIDRPQIFDDVPKIIFDNKLVYLEMEEPNRFFSNVAWFNHFRYKFSKVLSICPFTTEWLIQEENREFVFMPIFFTPPQNIEKIYDIIYCGHMYQGKIEENVFEILDFNYCVVSNTNHWMTTHKEMSHQDKLELISLSKISLVHNLLYPTDKHIKNVKKIDKWQDNKAFSHLDEGIVPQIKGRVFEAAMCKSLILCQKDHWNIIERFFEPGKEFVYYERGKASEKIKEILENYNEYLPVIEAAYIKVQNYTTDKFYEKYLKDIKI